MFFIVVVVLLIFGGFMSYVISRQGAAAVPMIKVQTENPEASPFTVTADKGAYFFIYTVVCLGSVVGMGATLALVFRLLNRQVEIVKHEPDRAAKAQKPANVSKA